MKLTIAATDVHTDTAQDNRLLSGVKTLVGKLRQANANRALHRQFESMDDALLRDIGIGDDEIYRIRAGHRILPRAWK